MDNFPQTLSANAVTGAVAALIYVVVKLFRRSSCASHTRCCDIDVARDTTIRQVEMVVQQTHKSEKPDSGT